MARVAPRGYKYFGAKGSPVKITQKPANAGQGWVMHEDGSWGPGKKLSAIPMKGFRKDVYGNQTKVQRRGGPLFGTLSNPMPMPRRKR